MSWTFRDVPRIMVLRTIWDNSNPPCGHNRIWKTVSQCAFRPGARHSTWARSHST